MVLVGFLWWTVCEPNQQSYTGGLGQQAVDLGKMSLAKVRQMVGQQCFGLI